MSAIDVTIDTLDFAALLKIGLEDIPGASQREWTQHGPVDPGITILELLAWQFEQRLFMADQVTESMVRSSLRLLGLAEPFPALAASTVLSVKAPGAANPLPAGTAFGLQGDSNGRVFATDADVWVQPVTAVDVSGQLFKVGDVLELALTVAAGVAGAAAGELSLLVEVAAAPGVPPSWHRDAVDVEPPAVLRWEAVGPAGSAATVTVSDGTGALRRSGLLALPWPAVWDEPGAAKPRLRAIATAASYTEAVEIVAVSPNAVVARHREPRTADVTDQVESALPLPDQLVTLAGTAGRLLDGDGDVVLSVTERDGVRHDWIGVRSWVGVGPADRVFLVDRGRGQLRFGDGRSGRILRPGPAPGAEVRFFLGAGRQGNLSVFRSWGESGGPGVAVNPVAADGGEEDESVDSARQRAADALAVRDRTVTAEDARELAVTTPGLGLARAHVSPGLHPAFPCGEVPGALAVTIVPYAAREGDSETWTAAPQPDAGALSTTLARLEATRLIGQEPFVLAPVYRRVAVELGVSAMSKGTDARDRIVDALRRYLDPLVGGTEGKGWPFGGAVRPSALSSVVQRALGPEASITRLAVALDDGPPSDCADAEIGSRELVWLAAATVTWVVAQPASGGLR